MSPGRVTQIRHRAWVAASVLVLYGTTIALSLVHLATSVHTYCAEHGVVEEIDSTVSPLAVDDGDTHESLVPGTAPAEAHETCLVHCGIPGDRPRLEIGEEPTRIPSLRLRSYECDASPAVPLKLLALAPKTSPPVA